MATKIRVGRASTRPVVTPSREDRIIATTATGVKAFTYGGLEDAAVAASETRAEEVAEEKGAEAGAEAAAPYAAAAAAAADETAASVAGAAIQAATLPDLQAITIDPWTGQPVAEGRLGVVYGGADRGTYRYLSAVWTYESDTLPQVDQAQRRTSSRADRSARVLTHRGAFQYPEASVDANGRTNRYVQRDGRTWFSGLGVFGLYPRRSYSPRYPIISDLDGASPLSMYRDGYLAGSFRSLSMPVTPKPARSVAAGIWGMTDLDGRASLAIEPDGTTFILLSPYGLRANGGRLWLSPAEFRGDVRGQSVRWAGLRMISAVVQEADLLISEVLQRTDTTATTAVVASAAPLRYYPTFGQSNAGGGSDYVTTLQTTPFPHHTLTFEVPQFEGTAVAPASTWTGFRPLNNLPRELSVMMPMGIAMEAWDREAGRASDGRVWFACRKGGAPITDFVPSLPPFENLMASVQAAVDLSALYGRTVFVPAVHWVQGETATSGYAAALTTLIANIKAGVQARTGQATPPIVVISQINNSDTASGYNQVVIDQLAVARTIPGVVMAGPMYHLPIQEDGQHPNQLGKRMFGESVALCLRQLEATGAWNPLWPISVARDGANIDITFAPPPGGGPLQWDTDWILAAANYGFTYTDDSGAPPTISSVTITGADTVRIVLASTPTGANKRVLYAMGQDSMDDGWAGARGQLYSPTTRPNLAELTGIAGGPEFIRHYCVRFEESVA